MNSEFQHAVTSSAFNLTLSKQNMVCIERLSDRVSREKLLGIATADIRLFDSNAAWGLCRKGILRMTEKHFVFSDEGRIVAALLGTAGMISVNPEFFSLTGGINISGVKVPVAA